ncbi:hypothetical protein GUJ93_ZPchr0001g32971 [Zizania palustris]|uniref:Uncharacterized protein n=1 Tax=Zizania palustris TaxID=103762 RepID=A0A8J5RTH1_ZIZPA|nr:hypothetical protein GUJ93_ZPchr0001g32971 [Zizania palustris]
MNVPDPAAQTAHDRNLMAWGIRGRDLSVQDAHGQDPPTRGAHGLDPQSNTAWSLDLLPWWVERGEAREERMWLTGGEGNNHYVLVQVGMGGWSSPRKEVK